MNERVPLPDTTTGQNQLSEHSVLRRELEAKPTGLNLLVAALDAQNSTESRRRDSVVVPNKGHPSHFDITSNQASSYQNQGNYSTINQGFYSSSMMPLGNGFLHGVLSGSRSVDADQQSSRGSLSPRGNPPDPTMSSASSTSSTSSSSSANCRRKSVPDTEKTEAYWEKRKRNNEAAKRSREKRRMNDMAMESQLMKLSQENSVLKKELETTSVVAKIPKLEHNPAGSSAAILPLPTIPATIPILPGLPIGNNLPAQLAAAAPAIQPQAPTLQVPSMPPGLPALITSQPTPAAPSPFVPTGPLSLAKQEISGTQQHHPHSFANLFPNGFPTPASNVHDPTSVLTSSTSNPVTGNLSADPISSNSNMGLYSPFLQGPNNALMQHLSAQLQYSQAAAAAAMLAAQNRGLLTSIPPQTLPLNMFQSSAVAQAQIKQASPDSTVGKHKIEPTQQGPSTSQPPGTEDVKPTVTVSENKQYLRYKLLERNRRIESQSNNSASNQVAEPRPGGILGSLLSPSTFRNTDPERLTIAAPRATKPTIPDTISTAPQPQPAALGGLSLKQCLSSLAVHLDGESGNRLTDSSTSGTSVAASDSGESQASPSSSRGGDSLTSGSQHSPTRVLSTVGSLENGGEPHEGESYTANGPGPGDKDRYLERRRRNNEAAKRCRANRRALFEYRFKRAQQLEEENAQLKEEMQKLAMELAELKKLMANKKENEDLRNLAENIQSGSPVVHDHTPDVENRASSTPSDLTSHRDSGNEGSGNNSPAGLIVDECVSAQ